MFDSQLVAVAAVRTPGEGVRACAQLENAACAARLQFMADLLEQACAADGAADREQWRLDNWGSVCAQIGAAHAVTSGIANGLLLDAVVLRERLPKVAAVFATGRIAYRLVHQICARTLLVKDPAALRLMDTELAELVASAGAMSVDQAEKAIDALILKHDRYAVRRTQTTSRGHRVDVHVDDASGSAQVDADLAVTDAVAVDRRLDALAATVCERDPRTTDQRRAAGLGAMGFGWDRLPCLCESPGCDATAIPPVGGIVIHVIAHPNALATTTDDGPEPPDDGPEPPPDDGDPPPPPDAGPECVRGGLSGEKIDALDENAAKAESDSAADESDRDSERAPVGDLDAQRRGLVGESPKLLPEPWYSYTWAELTEAIEADRGEYCPARPGVILGGPVVPAPVTAQVAMFATVGPLIHPGQAPCEPHYRPSKKLSEFVRCRDLTCRFPGCTRPATVADLDHTIPYPWGPTAASNLACLCREHHLLKTFWAGWTSRQFSDGTLVWTDPTGHTYTTYPGSKLLFPELCTPTADVTAAGAPPPKHTAGLTMPKRGTTRAQERRNRIDAERQENIEWLALSQSIPPP